jgi:hypothetical protein
MSSRALCRCRRLARHTNWVLRWYDKYDHAYVCLFVCVLAIILNRNTHIQKAADESDYRRREVRFDDLLNSLVIVINLLLTVHLFIIVIDIVSPPRPPPPPSKPSPRQRQQTTTTQRAVWRIDSRVRAE